jgi:hypothetical protein
MRRLAVLAAAAFAASGCTSGGDERTREAWAAEANDVCRTYARRIRALGTPATPAAAEDFIRRALPLAREEVERLGELEQPPADADEIELMLDTVREGLDSLDDAVAAGDADDAAELARATERGRLASQRADAIARRLGAGDCVSRR